MITVGLALLLALAIFTGLNWHPRSLPGYFLAVVAALGLWAAAFALRQTYTAILPLILGALGSLLLGLVGLRSAHRVRRDESGSPGPWLLGATLVLAPFLFVAVSWWV